MNNKAPKFECAPIPEALEAIFAPRLMSKIDENDRQNLIHSALIADGSRPDKAMTCLAAEDHEQIRKGLLKKIKGPQFERFLDDDTEKRVRGLLQGMNRHCDECARANCEYRVDLTRQQIIQISTFSNYTNSRRSKVQRPSSEDAQEW